jgi:hypothetical protein
VNYLIAGLAKSGTTILFSLVKKAIGPDTCTFFEPDRNEQFTAILDTGRRSDTLSKILIGRVNSDNMFPSKFDRHIVIYRDPRDQFISMLLYLYYDFQLSGDTRGFRQASRALERKIAAPAENSTIELYNEVSSLVGRAPIAVFKNLHKEQRAYIDTFTPFLLRYEDFIDGDLQALEQYLSLDLQHDAEVPEIYQRVSRSRAYGDWKHWLNQEDLEYIHGEWGETLSHLGYAAQTRPGNLIIPRSTSLDYIMQFDPAGR